MKRAIIIKGARLIKGMVKGIAFFHAAAVKTIAHHIMRRRILVCPSHGLAFFNCDGRWYKGMVFHYYCISVSRRGGSRL